MNVAPIGTPTTFALVENGQACVVKNTGDFVAKMSAPVAEGNAIVTQTMNVIAVDPAAEVYALNAVIQVIGPI